MTYLECWTAVAKSLLAQALAGEPELVDSLPKPMEAGSFGFAATLEGEEVGQFSIFVDAAILDEPQLGESVASAAGSRKTAVPGIRRAARPRAGAGH